MAPHTFPRTQGRRRSSCPSFFWVLVIAWAVIMVGSNIARVLMLPEFLVRTQREDVEEKPPNYYEILGVSPLVADKTLKQLRGMYAIDLHPDKIQGSPEAYEKFLIVQEAFETLLDGRLRCEYDKQHGIKGKWPVQACRIAFREEYRELQRNRYEKWKEILDDRRTSGTRKSDPKASDPEGGEPTSSKVRTKRLMPKTGKPSGKISEPKSSQLRSEDRPPAPDTEARIYIPVATVEVDPGKRDAVEIVASLTSKVSEGFIGGFTQVKVKVQHWSEEVLSFIGYSIDKAYLWTFGGHFTL